MTKLYNFKDEMTKLLENTNISIDEGKILDIFPLDSAHDTLYQESLASVTTNLFLTKNIPVGVSGEDRYVWFLKEKKNMFENVIYFGVEEYKNKHTVESRKFWFLKDDGGLVPGAGGIKNGVSMDTSKFLSKMFGIPNYNNKNNDYFLFQTVHDAGKQLVNTHMPTVSNHIDSAGTPIRDKRQKTKDDPVMAPSNYNNPASEGAGPVPGEQPLADKFYINSTVMSDDGRDNDADWALGKVAIEPANVSEFRPWFHTKYSLLIYRYIKDNIFEPNPALDANKPETINLFVTNFIWQLTLVFCYKSFSIPQRPIAWSAIQYLRTLEFTKFQNKRVPYYTLFNNSYKDYYQYFDNWFNKMYIDQFGEDPLMWTQPSAAATTESPWVVTQAICAEELLKQKQFKNSSIISRSEGSPKTDTNVMPLFQKAAEYYSNTPKVYRTILQIIKFSGDTSHMVQTILQHLAMNHIKTIDPPVTPDLPDRITILTTLERILSGRMLNYIKAPGDPFGLNNEEKISVMFETGVYLQEEDKKHKKLVQLVNAHQVNAVGVEPPTIKYFGLYVMENEEKRIHQLLLNIKNKYNSINTNIPNNITEIWDRKKQELKLKNPENPENPENTREVWELILKEEAIWNDTIRQYIDSPDLNQPPNRLYYFLYILKQTQVSVISALVYIYNELIAFEDILTQIINALAKSATNIQTVYDKIHTNINDALSNVLFGFSRMYNPKKKKNVPRHTSFDSVGYQDKEADVHISGEFSNLTLNMDHTDPDFSIKRLTELIEKKNGEILVKILTELKQNTKYIFDYLNLGKKIEEATKNNKDLLILLKKIKFKTDTNIKTTFWGKFNGTTYYNTDKSTWYITPTISPSQPLNLLLLANQFNNIKEQPPFIIYQNAGKGNISTLSELSKYIKERTPAKPKPKGYLFFEDFFKPFFNRDKESSKNDLTGLIYLIKFFVNSGNHANSLQARKQQIIYEQFKEQSETLITILEQLNTIPGAQKGGGQSAAGRRSLKSRKTSRSKKTTKVKRARRSKMNTRVSKKTRKKKKKLVRKKSLLKGGAGGSNLGATHPVHPDNILIEIIQSIKQSVKEKNNEAFALKFYSSQIYALLHQYTFIHDPREPEDEDFIQGFLKRIYSMVSVNGTQLDSNVMLAELYYIKENFKDAERYVELLSPYQLENGYIPSALPVETADTLSLILKNDTNLIRKIKDVTWFPSSHTSKYYYNYQTDKVMNKGNSLTDKVAPSQVNKDEFWINGFMELLNLQVESYTYYNGVAGVDDPDETFVIPSRVVETAREITTRSKTKRRLEYETFLHNFLFFNPKITESLVIEPLTENGEEVAFIWRNFDFIYRIYLFDIIEEFLKLLKTYTPPSPPINIDISKLAKDASEAAQQSEARSTDREKVPTLLETLFGKVVAAVVPPD